MKPRRAEVAGWASLSINMIERGAESRLEDVRASDQASESGFGLRSHRPSRRSCARREARRAERWNDRRGRVVRPFAFLLPSLFLSCYRLCDALARDHRLVDKKSWAKRRAEAEQSGDVALGIIGSSMRRDETSRRGAEQDSRGAGCRDRHQRLVDEKR